MLVINLFNALHAHFYQYYDHVIERKNIVKKLSQK